MRNIKLGLIRGQFLSQRLIKTLTVWSEVSNTFTGVYFMLLAREIVGQVEFGCSACPEYRPLRRRVPW